MLMLAASAYVAEPRSSIRRTIGWKSKMRSGWPKSKPSSAMNHPSEVPTQGMQRFGQVLWDVLADLRHPSGIVDGFGLFGEVVFEPGDLVVLAVDERIDQTKLGYQFADHVGVAGRELTIVCSCRETVSRVKWRMLSVASGVPYLRLLRGENDPLELGPINRAARLLGRSPIVPIDACPEVVEIERSLKRGPWRPKLVLLESLQLLRDSSYGTRDEAGQVLRGLKRLAKGLGTVVLVLASVSGTSGARFPLEGMGRYSIADEIANIVLVLRLDLGGRYWIEAVKNPRGVGMAEPLTWHDRSELFKLADGY